MPRKIRKTAGGKPCAAAIDHQAQQERRNREADSVTAKPKR